MGVRFLLDAQAETAFPAGNNNLTAVCCHGISTEMLFFSRSSQQNEVATNCGPHSLLFLSVIVVFLRGNLGFREKTHIVKLLLVKMDDIGALHCWEI